MTSPEWPDGAPDDEAPQQCARCGAGYVSLATAAECCGGRDGHDTGPTSECTRNEETE